MHSIYKILLFSFFITPLLSQSDSTILAHLQKGKTLKLEWVHQQYLSENESKPDNYPLYPDQMKEGEGEVFVGLKLQMDQCAAKPCAIKIWIEYVSSVQFPARQKVTPSFDIMNPTTPDHAKHFPKIADTRYVLNQNDKRIFKLGLLDSIPLTIQVSDGLLEEEWNRFQLIENTMPEAFNFFFLKQFLATIWQQEWSPKSHYKVILQQQQFGKNSIHFFKPVHPPKTTIITGKIISPITDKVAISKLGEGSWIKTWGQEDLTLDTNNQFQINASLSQPSMFSLFHGINILMLYIEPGDSLQVEIDANAFYRKTTFDGNGVNENQFLLDYFHQIKGDTVYGSLDMNLLQKNQLDYLASIKGKQQRDIDYLKAYPQTLNLEFWHHMDRYIRLNYAQELWYHAKFFYRSRDAKLLPAYTSYAQQLSSYFFRLPSQKTYDFALESYLEFQKILLKGRYVNHPFSFRSPEVFDFAKMLYTPKNAFRIGRLLLFVGNGPNRSKILDFIFDDVKTICKDSVELAYLKDYKNPTIKRPKSNGFKVFPIGHLAPNWHYQNPQGDSIHLSNFRGKYLLLHIGISNNLAQAMEDLSIIKQENNSEELAVFSIISHSGDTAFLSAEPNIAYISPKEMLILRDSYQLENNANNYFLIAPDGKVLANPFFTSSFFKLKSAIATLPTPPKKERWQPTAIFWRNLGIFSMMLLGLGAIYTQRKRTLAKREQQKRQLVELELKGIRAQMNPHFLFNALSSIQNLIRKKEDVAADRYLTQFAGLVRKILRNSEQEFITLEEEIAAIKQYCSLEALRTPFDYEINIAEDIDGFNTYIPGMLLQPLIENAILHGLMPQKGAKNLWINIQSHPQGLACEVIDNGIGIHQAKAQQQRHKAHQKSFGMALIRQRIQLLVGQEETDFLKIQDRSELNPPATGTIVNLIIPIET